MKMTNVHCKEKGQASLEAILLAVIGVIVILGIVYQFNSAFKKYTVDLYGNYYRCLLETGELPGTGSVCKDKSAEFAIANGKALVKDGDSGSPGSGGGQGGNGSGSSGKGGSGNKAKEKGDTRNSAKSDSGGGGGGGSNGGDSVSSSNGSGGGSVVGRLKALGKQRSTPVGSAGDKGQDDSSGGGTPIDGLKVSGNSRSYDSLRGAKTKMAFSLEGSEYQRPETAAVAPISAVTAKRAASERGDSLRPRKTVEKGERSPATKRKDDDGGSFSIGNLFRILLIVGIIVAIAVFFGGQVLQISKSKER